MENQNTPSPVEWVMNDFCRLIKLLPNQIFLIQFPPMSDKTVVLTHVKLHVTQEPSHNIQVTPRTVMDQQMLFVKPRAKNPSGSHPENKLDVMVVNHQQGQFFQTVHQKVKSIQSVLPNVQMETKVNGEQDAARKKANTFGIQLLLRLKPHVIKPSDWLTLKDLSGFLIHIHINLRKPK